MQQQKRTVRSHFGSSHFGSRLSLTGAPAAVAYKSRSDGIVDVLQDLKEKAEEDLITLPKAETNDRHNERPAVLQLTQLTQQDSQMTAADP